MNLINVLNKRYTVKEFDTSKTISDEDFEPINPIEVCGKVEEVPR